MHSNPKTGNANATRCGSETPSRPFGIEELRIDLKTHKKTAIAQSPTKVQNANPARPLKWRIATAFPLPPSSGK
jgi:hypothetical protein